MGMSQNYSQGFLIQIRYLVASLCTVIVKLFPILSDLPDRI